MFYLMNLISLVVKRFLDKASCEEHREAGPTLGHEKVSSKTWLRNSILEVLTGPPEPQHGTCGFASMFYTVALTVEITSGSDQPCCFNQ